MTLKECKFLSVGTSEYLAPFSSDCTVLLESDKGLPLIKAFVLSNFCIWPYLPQKLLSCLAKN